MKSRIRLEKESHKFSVAHMTVFPNGKKEKLHGHNYSVSLSVEWRSHQFEDFVDFSIIKKLVKKICDEWDEHVLLAQKCPFHETLKQTEAELEFKLCGTRYILPLDEVIFLETENISVEGLSAVFAEKLKTAFQEEGILKSLHGFEVGITETHGQTGYARLDF